MLAFAYGEVVDRFAADEARRLFFFFLLFLLCRLCHGKLLDGRGLSVLALLQSRTVTIRGLNLRIGFLCASVACCLRSLPLLRLVAFR
jgi:hypothetical protein